MRKCPFCNMEVKLEMPAFMYIPEMKKMSFLHHCNDNTCVFIIADTEDEIIAEWNGREASE